MNLYTAADGLFGTHVTWADIEEDMQRELDTVASFGSNKTAKDIGDGNVSRAIYYNGPAFLNHFMLLCNPKLPTPHSTITATFL